MDVTQKIRRSFADEHVIGTDPPMRPEQPNIWRRRINAFAGRSLSDKAMTAEQALRSGMQRLYGLALSSGRVEGLDVMAEAGAIGTAPGDALIQLSPGLGIARSGEDVQAGRTTRLPIGDLSVVIRVDHADMLAGGAGPITPDMPDKESLPLPDADGNMAARIRPELPRKLGDTLSVIAGNKKSQPLPHVAVLLAQPVVTEILGRPLDPCAPDPRDDPYVDLQRIDGARLILYLWPSEMIAIDGGPDYGMPPDDAALRNRLAYSIFDTERLQAEGEMHPWEAWGLPLALVGFRSDWTLAFVDRHAVARVGGTPKERSPIVAGGGDARLWQAQLDQFTGQLTEMSDFDPGTVRKAFVRLPPVGLLPPSMLDTNTRRQHFFPPDFSVTAVPLAQSNFNLVVSESSSLAPIDRGAASAVEMLVPVPDSVYEPGLLEVEQEDPRFGQAIKALREDRETWLVRRQMARRRYDRLLETVSGAVMGWPATDLPLEENSPAPHVQTPVEVTRTRRIASASAKRSHVMLNARATLTVSASDTIWFWVRIQDASQMTGLSLRLGSGFNPNAGIFTKGVFWGVADVMPIASETAGLAARRVGDLPEANIWVRLEVPATAIWDSAGSNLDGFAINSVEFTQRGGDVEWASFGKLDAAGLVYTYIADDAPAGATLITEGNQAAGWPWTTVAGRETIAVDDFGTVVTDDVRRASALDKFRSSWTQSFLAADIAAVDENGIGAFLNTVDARLKATNDAIDLGFVRARSDIYRVRQIMLGADAASRLVTSPALADLALRDEGARATSKGINDFLLQSVVRKPTDAVINMVATPPPPPPPPPPPTGFQSNFMVLNSVSAFQPQPALTLFGATVLKAAPPPPPPPATFLAMPLALTTPLMTPAKLTATTALSTQSVFQTAVARPATSLLSTAAAMDMSRYRASDIQRQIPIAGLVERTISVAERLTPQPAVQALEYALASKAAVVTTLSGLSKGSAGKPTGIAIDDIPIAGFHNKTTSQTPTLAELLADMARPLASQIFIDEDVLPQTQAQKHESDYFTYAVQAIDNSVAIMRLVEGRVALFEELAAELADLKAEITASADQAATYLRSVDVEVAEARHDLGTAERLREEEKARIEGVNARRAAILATHVNAIAWRRARAVDVRDEIPLIEIASGLAPNPVVVCRREHDEAPDEIHDYVQLLREVPVSWFPAVAEMVKRIERLESAQAAMRTMLERAIVPRMLAAPFQVTAVSRFLIGVQNAMVAARQVVDARRNAVTMLDAARIPSLSLVEAHTQLTTLSTIGDLITGSHRQPVLTRAANDEIDGLTTVAACLHESFGEVAPIIRLGWAETLSEFDRPAPLANLAGLPGWGEIPIELRRKLQGFVDWLFSRVDLQQQPAKDAVNELVRVCLLMAAHSPVDKIIPAHLVTPAPAKLGSKLFLALDISRVRKGMTMLVRDDQDRIVSRAVVDDIVDGRVQATVTQISMPVTTFTPAMRFQLVAGIAR